MSKLFTPLALRELTIRNRIFVSPMCQYSSHDGLPTDWHLVHLGSRAVGGAGMVIAEATAISPEGRISPDDAGIWNDEQVQAYRPITDFIRSQGATPAVQLAHAGRKASTAAPWEGGGPVGPESRGWTTKAPSPLPFAEGYPVPEVLSLSDIDKVVSDFERASKHSQNAGFQVVEIHMAHGYLLHEFLSPLSNQRSDEYGGSFEDRARLPLRVAQAVRDAWPQEWPVLVRISASDWVDGGWDLQQSLQLAERLKAIGIDLIDCSSGGNVAKADIPLGPGYQTAFAETIRREVGIATAAVGMITDPIQAEHILRTGQADAVALARELLRDPYWPLHAAHILGSDIEWPKQYQRAKRKIPH
jgi:2,4-dienoyl-CoA reductase-like NADH-dependent reductase (Old Yellow Enzyme family)